MQNELVSIITPVYNAEKYLRQTIESVQNQTYKNYEMILVDDKSTDNSLEIIKQYAKKNNKIKYYALEQNSGTAVARNIALNMSKGRFIAYLDADDKWKKDKLEKQIKYMVENNYYFTCTDYEKIKENGNSLKKIIKMPNEINYKLYIRNTIIQTVGVMVDTKYINKNLLEMPNLRRRQDAATWCQILKAGYNCYRVPEVLCYYRSYNKSLSSNKFKSVKGTWYLYREVEKLSFIKSCWCFIGYVFNALKKRIYIF